MQAVEAFVERNRKEAEDSINQLTKEAETLRARLQKVEAALERWKAVENALREGAPRAPVAPMLEAIPPGDAAVPGRWKGKVTQRPTHAPIQNTPRALAPVPAEAGERK